MGRTPRLVAAIAAIGAMSATSLVIGATSTIRDPAQVTRTAQRVLIPEPPVPLEQRAARELVAVINIARIERGLAPFEWHDLLFEAATIHSKDMATTGLFSHTGSDESTPSSRLTRVGFDWSNFGENLAFGYTTPQSVYDAWYSSSGHRQTLFGDFDYAAIAVAVSASGVMYWTLVVAS